LALENNRDLRVATARVAEARAMYGIQIADGVPTITLGAGDTVIRLPGDVSGTGRSLLSRRYDVNLGVAAFELDFWGRVASLRDAALASFLASEQARRSFRLALIADVVDLYLVQCELAQRLALARDILRARTESRALILKRKQVGIAGDLDYLSAEGALQAIQTEIAALERQREAADNSMRLLAGLLPDGLPSGLALSEQGLDFDMVVDLPADVLLRRPDVGAAEQALIAANANIGAARAAFFPRIALTAGFGTASSALSGLFQSGSEAWTFQPSLALPLFDGGRNQANLDLAEARKVLAVAQYEKTVQQAFREIADLLAARARLRQQLDAQESAERTQAERLKIVEARYRGGIASYLELLDAQLRRQWLSTANQLFKTLGAGQQAS
jgi:multidrug efflux system outer membrane protein